MISQALKDVLIEKTSLEIQGIQEISGGDINSSYKVNTKQGDFFLKVISGKLGHDILFAEKGNLEFLSRIKKIRIPEIIDFGQTGNESCLLIEYLEFTSTDVKFWENFGHQLAQLHLESSDQFGSNKNNFIGRLEQCNQYRKAQKDHIWLDRFLPQIQSIEKANLLDLRTLKALYTLESVISRNIPVEPASAIHGDLWSGNFSSINDSNPVIYDPASSYSHREFDLSMMCLFGTIPSNFFSAYHACYPLEKDWQRRMSLFQIYYLMVHINMFGNSYAAGLNTKLKDWVKG